MSMWYLSMCFTPPEDPAVLSTGIGQASTRVKNPTDITSHLLLLAAQEAIMKHMLPSPTEAGNNNECALARVPLADEIASDQPTHLDQPATLTTSLNSSHSNDAKRVCGLCWDSLTIDPGRGSALPLTYTVAGRRRTARAHLAQCPAR